MDPDEPAQQPYEVILSPLAVQDLAEIVTFIAADNPPIAERFGRALIQKTRLLVTFPELGRVVPEFTGASERARELVHKAYRIIYRVDHGRRRVEVSRFWHAGVVAAIAGGLTRRSSECLFFSVGPAGGIHR